MKVSLDLRPRTHGDDLVAIGTAVPDAADKLRMLETDAPNMQVLDPLRIGQNVQAVTYCHQGEGVTCDPFETQPDLIKRIGLELITGPRPPLPPRQEESARSSAGCIESSTAVLAQ
jgi:hypothetical protein